MHESWKNLIQYDLGHICWYRYSFVLAVSEEYIPSPELTLSLKPIFATAFTMRSLLMSCDRITNTPCRELSTPRIFQSTHSISPSIHVKNMRNQWKPNIIFNLMMVMTWRVVRRLSRVVSWWPDLKTFMLTVTLRTR